MAERNLNLYSVYQYNQGYWDLASADRKDLRANIAHTSSEVAEASHLYSLSPQRAEADFLIWSAWGSDDPAIPKQVLSRYSQVTEEWRKYVSIQQTLWGFTRPSMYSRGKSEQDMDPFESGRSSYLVIYPFSKTKEWYLMSMDARQGMMNEHIKIGKQYFDVKQLLLYSFGLQDHEFIVSYEVEDLVRFSELVNALRNTEGRRYTLLDTPIITGIYKTAEEFIG